jgi:hypothetical protein
MKATRFHLILVVLVLAALACSSNFGGAQNIVGSGTPASQERSVRGFTAIEIVGSADVDVTVGEDLSVVVEADDNILPLIETTVRGGTLIIRTKSNTSISPKLPVRVTVSVPSLDTARIKGSGNFTIVGLDAGSVQFELPGSGNITAQGEAEHVTVSISGSGVVVCDALKAQSVDATINGSGDISVYASKDLSATIRGSGTVRYLGDPEKVSQAIPGSGSVVPGR